MSPLETYLRELREIRASGAAMPETSGYGPLANLLNKLGDELRPKVRCFIQLKNSGAGAPDGGLFTADEVRDTDADAPLHGIPMPARGVIEVKSTADELAAIVETLQVGNYVRHYGQLLLTNYRGFVLLKRGAAGGIERLESFEFAPSEEAFWEAAAHPRTLSDALGERCVEYLKRVMLHAAPLDAPRDLAFFLASYARDARARVEAAGDLPALAAVREALEQALGMTFDAQRGEHFFRSTLVQTLFYGVFSAWVLWHRYDPARRDRFDWRSAAWTLHVPMIKALFEQVATPSKLGPLGLVEVLDWAASALNRVERPAFFQRFVEKHAVQYFYEPFLEAYDPALRRELGVWYTPPEIVEYMVERVDTALREELDIADGLADPRVFVLDPCCGTGGYLAEVLRRIERTLTAEKGHDALAAASLKEAAMKRVLGFEIMPAPFVVAHLQMGVLLHAAGVPLDEAHGERAGIFLTNSLTGWEFSGENPQLKNWPELEAERAGAGRVKQEKPILVILGNPPYNAFAGASPKEEEGLVEPYKGAYERQKTNAKGKPLFDRHGQPVMERRYRLSDREEDGGWGIRKFNLDDFYVRFFRVAERRIAEKTGRGIVCFISNFSYLGDPSFVVMRERFLREFDALWFDCLNGDSRETGKLTPDGKPDPSVFSTDFNREGIRLGTAVSLLVRKTKRAKQPVVRFREFWGVDKREELLASLNATPFARSYEKPVPHTKNRFSFRPLHVSEEYFAWPSVVSLSEADPISGLQEMRHGAFLDTDRERLATRMRRYFDPNVSWDAIKAMEDGLSQKAGGFIPADARAKVLRAESFDASKLLPYALYPFDHRWCYFTTAPTLWNRPRPELVAQAWPGNQFFITRMFAERPHEQFAMTIATELPDYHLLRPNAVAIPIRLHAQRKAKPKKDDGNGEFSSIVQAATPVPGAADGKTTANLSAAARAYLTQLGIKNPDADAETAGLVWMHALAIGYAPAYLAENGDGIRQDWPRIPLPATKTALLASAALGRQLAALLDTSAPVDGVDGTGSVRPELRTIAVLTAPKDKQLDLRVTAGWGHPGKDGVTMPGKGRLESRAVTAAKSTALGNATHDVFLNTDASWRNVPEPVWEFTIGGYRVLKKWLSYREHALLGRAMTLEEAAHFTNTARRIAAILLLHPELDANYEEAKSTASP